jgi:hypothetical protein
MRQVTQATTDLTETVLNRGPQILFNSTHVIVGDVLKIMVQTVSKDIVSCRLCEYFTKSPKTDHLSQGGVLMRQYLEKHS